MTADVEPIIVEETYAVEAPVVWKAITDPSQMSKWYFEPIESFQPEVGFETQFNINLEETDYLHLWRVTEVDPGKRLAYTFDFEGYDSDAVVVWELSAVPGGTKLTLTETGWETLPQNNPLFSREAGVAGWTYFLKESLKKFLEPNT